MEQITRVIFCTYPCLYSSLVLSELILASNIEVVAVVKSTRNLKKKENKLLSDLERIKASGITYTTYLLFITQGYKFFPKLFHCKSVKSICNEHQINIISTANINDPNIQTAIKLSDPDVIFCTHFNQLIHPSTYSLARESAVNLHPSLLPDLKGVDPAFYALTESYKTTGITLHHLAKNFDTGEVISQKEYVISESDTLLSLNTELFKKGATLFIDYSKGKEDQSSISKESNRYDSWPSRVQVKKFKRLRNFIFSGRLFR